MWHDYSQCVAKHTEATFFVVFWPLTNNLFWKNTPLMHDVTAIKKQYKHGFDFALVHSRLFLTGSRGCWFLDLCFVRFCWFFLKFWTIFVQTYSNWSLIISYAWFFKFLAGFGHRNQPTSIDMNSVRLCFQVFLEGERQGKYSVPLKAEVSDPIYDKKATCDLQIVKLSDCCASCDGSKTLILLCEKVSTKIPIAHSHHNTKVINGSK